MNAESTRTSCDVVVPFQIEPGFALGRLVRLDESFHAVLAARRYPAVVANLLGEAIALALALANGLKYDGVFTLQTKGDGPVSMLVAEVTSAGDLRACAQFDEERVAEAAGRPGAVVPRLLGTGYLAFTVDQGPDTERYQGITELGEATLSEVAHGYFRRSEQLETAVVLCADAARPGGPVAAALMVQRLPEGAADREAIDDAWRRAVALTGTASRDELLDCALPPERLLYRLYHEDGVRVFDDKRVRFRCRCSRERVEAMLRSFGSERLDEYKDDGRISVACEFCGASYIFDAGTLETL